MQLFQKTVGVGSGIDGLRRHRNEHVHNRYGRDAGSECSVHQRAVCCHSLVLCRLQQMGLGMSLTFDSEDKENTVSVVISLLCNV